MLIARAAVLTAITLPTLALGGDFWQDKPASEWSDKDARRLETKSPWAKETTATFGEMPQGEGGPMRRRNPGAGGGMGGPGGGGMGGPGGGGMGGPGGGGMGGPGGGGMGGPGGGGMGGPGGGGMGGPGGGMGGGPDGGGFEAPKVNVRWESATPMMEAASKLESPLAKSLAEWSKDYYVVTVTGMPMMRRRPEGAPSPDPARMKQMSDRLRGMTALKRKGKDDVAPERVETVQGADGMVMAFLFARTAGVAAEDKEVSFETAFGPMQVKSKFVLKEMQVKGKLEL
jgi:hypothetical protein